MPYALTDGATLSCTMGTSTASYSLSSSTSMVTATDTNAQIGTLTDAIPYTNIPTFGTCSVLTAAASGVSTPCNPITVTWLSTATSGSLNSLPIATTDSMCICCVGGVITCSQPGQQLVTLS